MPPFLAAIAVAVVKRRRRRRRRRCRRRSSSPATVQYGGLLQSLLRCLYGHRRLFPFAG